jgi:hypothetical protein
MTEQQIDHLLKLITLHTILWQDPNGHYHKLTGWFAKHNNEMKAKTGHNQHIDLYNIDINDLIIVNTINPNWPKN